MKIYFGFLFLITLVFAETKYNLEIERIVSQYDGDTFKVDLKNCNEPIFCKGMSIRVYGVDTPELKPLQPNAKEAKEFTRKFLMDKIYLRECSADKYFRLDCKVINSKGQDLASELIKVGLGKPYFGGTKD